MIEKNDCSIAVPPDDPEAFTDALVALRDNPTRRNRMATNARTFAESDFKREKLADQFVAFLSETEKNMAKHAKTC